MQKQEITWVQTDWKEICAFFGLNYLFGLISRPAIKEHWSTNPLIYSPFPKTVMT